MLRIGILGGGQLGRMLLQEAPNYPVDVHILESDPNCPASNVGENLYTGNFSSYDDVVSFGMQMDVLTIEIEHVNVDALQYLEDQGVKIIPRPACLRTIKDKIEQKKFYQQQGIQSPAYRVIHTRDELNGHLDFLPAAQKLAKGGYDGKGVQLILHNDDIAKGFDAPSVLEKLVDIDK
ncbi:MAG: 5-(carboxyamino)imidazole ribonucleotide synthase, partial [Bacteroidota bacterium]